MFTYDNTDDGVGWWTRVTHMVDGGFYGYPYDYKPQRPYTLWMMLDYGGGAPTGACAYNEDALPDEYKGNLFVCDWVRGQPGPAFESPATGRDLQSRFERVHKTSPPISS